MRTKTKKFTLVGLFFALIISICAILPMVNAKSAHADEGMVAREATVADLENSAYYTVRGASVRIVDPVGIRFHVIVEKSVYDQVLTQDGVLKEGVTTGTLVIPADLLDGELTLSTTKAENAVTNELWSVEKDQSGVATGYMKSLVYLHDIPEASLNRTLAVRGYATVDGQTYYTQTVLRSPVSVAVAACNSNEEKQEVKDSAKAIADKVAMISVDAKGNTTNLNAVDGDMNLCYDANAWYKPNSDYELSRVGAKLTATFTRDVKALVMQVADGLNYSVQADDGVAESVSVTGLAYNKQFKVLTASDMVSGSYTFNMNDNELYIMGSYGDNIVKDGNNIPRATYVSTVPGIDESQEQYYLHLQSAQYADLVFRSFSDVFVAGHNYELVLRVNAGFTMPSRMFYMKNASGNNLAELSTVDVYTVGNWSECVIKFTAPEGLVYTTLFLYSGKTDMYISDITLRDLTALIGKESGYTVYGGNSAMHLKTSSVTVNEDVSVLPDGTVGAYRHVQGSQYSQIFFENYNGLFESGYRYTFRLEGYATSFYPNAVYLMLNNAVSGTNLSGYSIACNTQKWGMDKIPSGHFYVEISMDVKTSEAKRISLWTSASGGMNFYISSVTLKRSIIDTRAEGSVVTTADGLASGGWVSDFDTTKELLSNVGSNTGAFAWTNYYPESSDNTWFAHINLSAYPYRVNLDFLKGVGTGDYYYSLTLKGTLVEWGNVYLLGFTSNGPQVATIAGQNHGDGTVGFYFTQKETVDNWALFSTNTKFEMYVEQITFEVEDFVEVGALDTTATKVIFPDVCTLDDYNFGALSAIVLDQGAVAVIDAGEVSSEATKFALTNTLRSLGVTKIDTLILTHPHSDHAGAMTYLIKHFDIGTFYYKDTDFTNKANSADMDKNMDAVLSVLNEKTNSDNTRPTLTEVTTYGQKATHGSNGQFTFWYNEKVYVDDYVADGNYFSLSMTYTSNLGKDNQIDFAYFGGDLPESASYEDGTADVVGSATDVVIWQINHHGTGGPYGSEALIQKLNPEYSVFSAVDNATYASLNAEVISRLKATLGEEVKYYYIPDAGLTFTLNEDNSVSLV